MINRQRLLSEFLELVQIPCHTCQERQIADVLKLRLADLDGQVSEDDTGKKIGGNCGNVLAFFPGSIPDAPTVMLSAHLDCVEPCEGIKPQRQDGIITSDGSTILGSDDKAGVAGILEALRVLKENRIPHGGIQVVFSVSEESGLNGSKNLDRSLLKADIGYALDAGGSPGEIVIRAPGQNWIVATIHGKTAHAGIEPEAGVNAIVAAAKAIGRIRSGRIDEETTANIGMINGGRATNIVPDNVVVACEARSRNTAKLEKQTAHMVSAFEEAAAECGARAEVQVSPMYDPFVLAEDSPAVRIAAQAAQNAGLASRLEATGGGSDANFYNSYGVPCAVLGIGMQKAHTTGEFIREQDLYDSARWVVEILKTAAGAKRSG